MGMYTGIRFKGYVKPKYRKVFENIAMNGSWNESEDKVFKKYGQIGRSGFIPCGCLSYMPDEWESEPFDEYGDGTPTDGFERTWNEETGYWTFQCSLKNYEDEIEEWFKIIPYFIEKIEYLEYFYEEWTYSKQYDLVDDEVKLINDKFKKYGYEY
jgi:hypothetical protein